MWPKKWKVKTIKKGLKLDFKVKWKRLNYDLHNVLGFYSLLFALVLGFTGLMFSYPSLKEFYSSSFNKLDRKELGETITYDTVPQQHATILDNALLYVLVKHSSADMMSVRLRKNEPVQDIQCVCKKTEREILSGIILTIKTDKFLKSKVPRTLRQAIGLQV